VVHRDNTKFVRLPDTASIFRAELYTLLLAIGVVRRSKEKTFVIFSNSVSSLQSIYGFNLDSDFVQNFLKDYTILAKNGKNLVLCWIPSHVGSSVMIKQMQLQSQHCLYLSLWWSFLPRDMYPHITKLIFDEWQEVWNCCAGNKLHAIRPTVCGYKQKTCLSRRDSVLLNRLRIGHTRLTHSFLYSQVMPYLNVVLVSAH